MIKTQKASKQVSLVLLGGTFFLTACNDDGAIRPGYGETRYDYLSRQDCMKDWSELCPPTSAGHGGMYYYYRYEKVARPKEQTHAVKVVRGGFGSSFRGSGS